MDRRITWEEPTLINAEALGHKQDAYLQQVNDTEMKHIITVLNDAYKSPERFKTFDKISGHNIGKLRLAGYKVEYFSDQREGSWYKVSW